MIELLCLVTNAKDDKKVKKIENKYSLPFNLAMYGKGTASSSLLNYFGLEDIKKYIYFSLINYREKNNILRDIDKSLNLEKPGHGILFTVPISSSTKHIKNKIEENSKEVNMDKEIINENKKNYELIVTIVNDGHSESVMNAAKSKGAGGGTILKGRSLLENSSKNQFLGITIEPEKDIVLIVANSNKKKEIMEAITDKSGLKTKGNGIMFSLPIDDAVGLHE